VFIRVCYILFALTELLYSSLILAVRERTECISRVSLKLKLNNRIERRSFVPGKAGSDFCCSVSPVFDTCSTIHISEDFCILYGFQDKNKALNP